MSYSILPNPKLTCGFVLVLTDRAGQTEEIECHNRATAEALAKIFKAKRLS